MEIKTRVLIVGGGLVGQSLALALAHFGIESVVVDREDPEITLAPPFDGRSSAIAAASWRMLDRLGVAGRIRDVQPIEDIRVSDGASPLFLHYDHRDLGEEPLGQMVENRFTRTALLESIAETAAVRLIAPTSVGRVRRTDAGAEASLADGTVIRAELCIAADGRQSRLRAEAGIGTVDHRYGQDGIVCTIAHELPHKSIAHERFLPAGPFAILPLTGNRSSLVWTERSDLAPGFMELDEAAFTAEIQRRIGGFLGEIEVVGPRFRYPLTLVLAKTFRAKRLALAGDAAHGIHPIAGQGFNLGLRDVAALAEVLGESARLGLDMGSDAVLERYEQWRRTDSLVMSVVTDGLNRLFSNDAVPVKLARDLGLGAVNRIRPLKKVLMRHAMGDVGDLPALLQP